MNASRRRSSKQGPWLIAATLGIYGLIALSVVLTVVKVAGWGWTVLISVAVGLLWLSRKREGEVQACVFGLGLLFAVAQIVAKLMGSDLH